MLSSHSYKLFPYGGQFCSSPDYTQRDIRYSLPAWTLARYTLQERQSHSLIILEC